MPELILVTGASGFLGTHIVDQLLKEGYRVRGVARGVKAEQLKVAYAEFKDQFEVVKISDISADQFPGALEGVDAVLHVASPLPGRADPPAILHGAIEGSLNVLRQAEKAGVRRFVVTSSIASVRNPQNSFTDKDWNPVTKEQALSSPSLMVTYAASKKFAELAVWEWADAHPDVDVTTLNPPFLYGPFSKHFNLATPDFGAMSTNLNIYNLLIPPGSFPRNPPYVDIRDVAKAHVLALHAPATSAVGRKRIIFSSPHGFEPKSALQYLVEKRPALKERLITAPAPDFGYDRLPIDFGRIEEVLSFRKEDFYSFEDTLLDTVDSILVLEDEWKNKGLEIQVPPYAE